MVEYCLRTIVRVTSTEIVFFSLSSYFDLMSGSTGGGGEGMMIVSKEEGSCGLGLEEGGEGGEECICFRLSYWELRIRFMYIVDLQKAYTLRWTFTYQLFMGLFHGNFK